MMSVLLVAVFFVSCANSEPSAPADLVPADAQPTQAMPSPTPVPTPDQLSYVSTSDESGLSALRCEDCRAVEVFEVIDAETIQTSDGPVRLYGVFVSPQEQNCFDEATERFRELAGTSVRLEPDLQETDSAGTPIRYVYTANGDSIDEIFITEGLARNSAFEGSHAPWLLFTAEKARQTRSGCIWENYDRLFPQRTPGTSG
jgi:endonuclease YncB( thermonuclease family)